MKPALFPLLIALSGLGAQPLLPPVSAPVLPGTNVYWLPTGFTPPPDPSGVITGYTIAWGTNGMAQNLLNTTAISNNIGPLSRTNHYLFWVRANHTLPPDFATAYSLPLAWEPPTTNWYVLAGRTTTNLAQPVWEPFTGNLPRIFTNWDGMSDRQRWFAADFLVLSNNLGFIRAFERREP